MIRRHCDRVGRGIFEARAGVDYSRTGSDRDRARGAGGPRETHCCVGAIAAHPGDTQQCDHFVQRAAGCGVDECCVVHRVQLRVQPGNFQCYGFCERAQHAAHLQIGQGGRCVFTQIVQVDDAAFVGQCRTLQPAQGLAIGLQLIVDTIAKPQ